MIRILAVGTLVGAALLLSGCGKSESAGLVDSAETAVRQALKDPESVQFRKVKIVQLATPAGDSPIVCGEFNAKTSFGGYAGFEPFAWHPNGQLLAESFFNGDGIEIAREGIASLCSGVLPQV